MRAMLLALFVCCLPITARAAEPDWRRMSTEALIDNLTEIDTEAPGLSGWGSYGGFIGEAGSGEIQTALLAATVNGKVVERRPPTVTPPMRELVRRGPEALPALLAHLDDARRTHLAVGGSVMDGGMFMAQGFATEYHARWPSGPKGCSMFCGYFGDEKPEPSDREADRAAWPDKYTVRVGDVCYALVGQIVGRNLSAVRYQPSAILVVNSPVHRPRLAEWTRRDWSGLTREQHRASLMSDVIAGNGQQGRHMAREALVRLRFYYPQTYARLAGEHADAKAAFVAYGARP